MLSYIYFYCFVSEYHFFCVFSGNSNKTYCILRLHHDLWVNMIPLLCVFCFSFPHMLLPYPNLLQDWFLSTFRIRWGVYCWALPTQTLTSICVWLFTLISKLLQYLTSATSGNKLLPSVWYIFMSSLISYDHLPLFFRWRAIGSTHSSCAGDAELLPSEGHPDWHCSLAPSLCECTKMFFLYTLDKVQIYFFSGFLSKKIITFWEVEGIIYADKLIIIVLAMCNDISSRVSMIIMKMNFNSYLTPVVGYYLIASYSHSTDKVLLLKYIS